MAVYQGILQQQSLIIMLSKSKNSEIYHQDFKKLNKDNLERDLVNINWDANLEVNNSNVDKSFAI